MSKRSPLVTAPSGRPRARRPVGRARRAWLVGFVGAALAASPPVAQGLSPRLEELIRRAKSLVERGHARRAQTLFAVVAERAPADPTAPLALCRLLLPPSASPSTAHPTPALRRAARRVRRLLDDVVDEDPDIRTRLEFCRGWADAVEGDHRAAIRRAARAARPHDPVAAGLMQRLAALAIRRGDVVSADLALTQARRVHSTDRTLWTDQAAVALARGRADQAVSLYRDALARFGTSASTRQALASALLASGQPTAALEVIQTWAEACFSKEQPPSRPAHCGAVAARVALQADAPSHAKRWARRALSGSSQTNPEPALLLGQAHVQLGERRAARRAFREALRRDPRNLQARESLEGLAHERW